MIIGITGNMEAGKSTAGKMIQEYFRKKGESTRILPFAEPLKEYALSLGWNGKKDEKGRKLLQLLGTECGRQCIDTNIWVNKWIDAAKICLSVDYNNIVVDDIRFNNEAQAIIDAGGIVIKIVRQANKLSYWSQLWIRLQNNRHLSERNILESLVDYNILNEENNLDDLKHTLIHILNIERH